MRNSVGIDLAIESVPDATSPLRLRHLLEKHALTQRICQEINAHLTEKRLLCLRALLVDVTYRLVCALPKHKAKHRAPA